MFFFLGGGTLLKTNMAMEIPIFNRKYIFKRWIFQPAMLVFAAKNCCFFCWKFAEENTVNSDFDFGTGPIPPADPIRSVFVCFWMLFDISN